MMTRKHLPLNWWWLDNHSISSKRSPWLQSTLSQLDEKTEAMLALIEEDADSFAKRAEMYYKKRPELMGMVQDFYRAHRSLAERYDQKEEPMMISITCRNYDSYPETFDHDGTAESEVYDPPDEDYGSETPEWETHQTSVLQEEEGREMRKLKDEIERLREENRIHRELLEEKGEEKREAIRQLSLAVGILKEENVILKEAIIGLTKKSDKGGGFMGKLFNFLNA
ncbi:hypothetical protein SAY87_026292 [Trapa incisa]|uniref:NAB domain-containing protein n=1 Tax=Trapa incisa TaxID=236973 RepID=A0AAN7GU83_9MYRT|nr:hypothetical protein SAY87_026292 [Trapa incisa]